MAFKETIQRLLGDIVNIGGKVTSKINIVGKAEFTQSIKGVEAIENDELVTKFQLESYVPDLAEVAITGDYEDLINKPTLIKGDKGDKGELGPQGVQGVAGATGAKGDKGDAFEYSDFTPQQLADLKGEQGAGIKAGGAIGQVFKKQSSTDFDADWEDESGGVQTSGSTVGYLQKLSATDVISNSVIKEDLGGSVGVGCEPTENAQFTINTAKIIGVDVTSNQSVFRSPQGKVMVISNVGIGFYNFDTDIGNVSPNDLYFTTTAARRIKIASDGIISMFNKVVFAQYTDGTEPAYQKGAQYFNTTINKMKIGGATAWETLTSI